MNPRIVSRLAVLAALLLCVSGISAQVCSTTTTVGKYLVLCNGFMSPAPNTSMVPTKTLGIATGDDTGTFRGTAQVTVGGLIVQQTVIGTVKQNKDCTGTLTYTQTINGQPAPPINLQAIVSEQGNRIDGMGIDSGVTISCVLRRLSNDEPVISSASTPKPGEKLELAQAKKP